MCWAAITLQNSRKFLQINNEWSLNQRLVEDHRLKTMDLQVLGNTWEIQSGGWNSKIKMLAYHILAKALLPGSLFTFFVLPSHTEITVPSTLYKRTDSETSFPHLLFYE